MSEAIWSERDTWWEGSTCHPGQCWLHTTVWLLLGQARLLCGAELPPCWHTAGRGCREGWARSQLGHGWNRPFGIFFIIKQQLYKLWKVHLLFSLHGRDAKFVKCCRTCVSMLTSLNVKNRVKIVQFHEKVVMIIASLINYKPRGSFMKLNVSNSTIVLRLWVTENKTKGPN